MVVHLQGSCSPHTVWCIDVWLEDIAGWPKCWARTPLVAGSSLFLVLTLSMAQVTHKKNDPENKSMGKASQASMRKVGFINDWEVPLAKAECLFVWWNKARPSTNHQLASDFQGGKAQQNSIMLQVFEAELLTFRTKKQSYRASDNGREKVSKTSFKRSKALERLKGSYGHVLTFCIVIPHIGAVSS